MRKILVLLMIASFCAYAEEIAVITKPISKGSLESQNAFIGTLHFMQSSKVASQTRGVVEEVDFAVGDYVKLDQKLAQINADVLEKEIQSKQARLKEAQYTNERQERELGRYRNLLRTESVSLQQYESIEYEQKSQSSNIAALSSELESAKMELTKKTIRAPIKGVIVDKKINRGEWIEVGDAICEILDTTSAEVIVDVPSSMLGYLKNGQEVGVKIEKRNYMGKIYAIIPRADINTRTFPVHITVENDGSFVDGNAARVLLSSGGKIEGNMVERDSIVNYLGAQSIFVVREDKAYAIPVEVLSIQGQNAIVRGNLKPTDLVVIRGQDRLKNGASVVESSLKDSIKDTTKGFDSFLEVLPILLPQGSLRQKIQNVINTYKSND